jgi:hypothetical protein
MHHTQPQSSWRGNISPSQYNRYSPIREYFWERKYLPKAIHHQIFPNKRIVIVLGEGIFTKVNAPDISH